MIKKIKKVIDKINSFDRKYKITTISAASSYYIIIALFSTIFLVYQIYGLYSKDIENFLLSKVLDIINPIYHTLINENVSSFSFNTFSVLILFNLMWSGSKIINNYNNIADSIYLEKRRKSYLKRLSAFLMFIMLLFIAFFEIAFVVYTNNVIIKFFDNMFILRLVQFIIEILIIYFMILIIYIYAPPIRMKIKDVAFGTGIATFGVYIVIILFLLVFSIYKKFHISVTIITIISTSFLLLYVLNIIINSGIIINYHRNKFGKNK